MLATRNPRLSSAFCGEFLLRFATRTFCAEFLKEPPRFTRLGSAAACAHAGSTKDPDERNPVEGTGRHDLEVRVATGLGRSRFFLCERPRCQRLGHAAILPAESPQTFGAQAQEARIDAPAEPRNTVAHRDAPRAMGAQREVEPVPHKRRHHCAQVGDLLRCPKNQEVVHEPQVAPYA